MPVPWLTGVGEESCFHFEQRAKCQQRFDVVGVLRNVICMCAMATCILSHARLEAHTVMFSYLLHISSGPSHTVF